MDCAICSYKCMTTSTSPRTAESAGPPHPPPTLKQVVLIRSFDGSGCFIHPAEVSRAVCGSIFAKQYIEQTLAISGGGRGIKFELVNALRLPDLDKDGQTVPNLAIRLKFRGPVPERVTIGNMITMKCSGYHDTDGCVREDHCLFCCSGHCPTSKQCPARLQAVQLQELQHDGAYSLLDIK
ncbi:hypothetical protein E2C01_050461 [Portunus trituberculatus]|uniref:Uncharacterized protein n=1 Tax=Portunus trituberculatus TaxID=210409 RepID=A0A5B7G8C0_PORTR|nr:hypothetical protein [Portunus trituberculatus]